MENIIYVVIGLVLGVLGLTKYKSKELPKGLSDDKVEDLSDKIDGLDKKSNRLNKEGASDLNSEEVENFWKNK